MSAVLIDSSVLLDVTTGADLAGEVHAAVVELSARRELVINPVIYSEVSISFARIEDLDARLPEKVFRREQLPWDAAFLAGKAFVAYRRRGGTKTSPLPDFFIGAHAAIRGYDLLTRDPGGFRSYFPTVPLLSPSDVLR